MSAEWMNVWAQIVIAIMQSVVAAAGVYTAYTVWKQRASNQDSAVELSSARELKQSEQTALEVRPNLTSGEYVLELVALVEQADKDRSRAFDEHPKEVNRLARRSMMATGGAGFVLSLLISIISISIFPSIFPGAVMAIAMVCLLAASVVWWRVFSASTAKASNHMWKQVEEVEDGLERRLVDEVKAVRFKPEMSLALHDRLLRTMPRVMPPMILLADRVVRGELVRRLESETNNRPVSGYAGQGH